MLEAMEEILQKAVEIAEGTHLFENPELLLKASIEKEFSVLKHGYGIKVFNMAKEINDGVFVYVDSPWKIAFTENGSSRFKNIESEDACQLLALSYIARELTKLDKAHKRELKEVNAKMHEIVGKYI